MRNPGIIAFAATVGILAPVVILIAGPAQRAMLWAPKSHSLEVNGVHVEATLDHKLVDPGGTVHLELTASRHVEIGIVVMGSSGSEGERVPPPPVAVMHETIELDANTPKRVSLKLRGAKLSHEDLVGDYSIYVLSAKAGEKLGGAMDRAGPSIPTGEIPDMDTDTQKLRSMMYKIANENLEDPKDEAMFGGSHVALFTAYTRAISDGISISAPDTAPIDTNVPVAITLTNTTKHAQSFTLHVSIPQIDDESIGIASDDVKIDDEETKIQLPAGVTQKVIVNISSKKTGVVGVMATVDCDSDARCDANYRHGALEAVQITNADTKVAAQ